MFLCKKVHLLFWILGLILIFAKPTLAGSFNTEKSKMGYIYIKRRNCTLWFWRHKNFATSDDLLKTKQRGRPVGCIYIVSWTFPMAVCCGEVFGHIGIYTSSWGFRRCSFRQIGQCEGLYDVKRVTSWLHVFLYVISSTGTNLDIGYEKRNMNLKRTIWNDCRQ